MSWQTLVTINGRDMGSGWIGLVRVHESLQPPTSLAYCCVDCGEIWARIYVYPKDDASDELRWMFYHQLCSKHGSGSIWINHEREHMDALPIEVLKAEFLLAHEDPDWYFNFPWRRRLLAYDELNAAKLPEF